MVALPVAATSLMSARKSPRQQQLEAALLYPVDWLDERTGLLGGLRYFLFRKVPRDTNWMQTLGAATLTAFLVQAITGVVLAMFYKPDPNSAYESIQHITNNVTLAGSCAACTAGCQLLHHPDVPAHGSCLPLRRVQVPA